MICSLWTLSAHGLDTVEIQFLGDTYISWQTISKTDSDVDSPNIFIDVFELLKTSQLNIINFEGVATGAKFPLVKKEYLLKMPLFVGGILRDAGISAATLANNHAMDYGFAGLFDTISSLKHVGIKTSGAGENLESSLEPIILPTSFGNVCVLSFTRTYPAEFWATDNKPGTAHLSFERTAKVVQTCAEKYPFTFAVFHWGTEGSREIQEYQEKLAHLIIDVGATAVIGHHPHVLQKIEIYKKRPIIYSLGNFAFGTRSVRSNPEGAAARFKLKTNGALAYVDIVPLKVNNQHIKFKPQLFTSSEKDPVAAMLPKNTCQKQKGSPRTWRCPL